MSRRRTAATRTAVLWVPDWPVVAALAVAGLGVHVPAAVLGGAAAGGTTTGQRLVAVSAVARAAGVRRGMRRRQAQERCPELVLLPADDARDAREFEPVAAAAETVVAGLEISRPGLLLLPAGGAARYHGSEESLARALVERVGQATGHECQVGVADGFLAAVLAAREHRVVALGASPTYLAPRPVGDLLHAATGEQGGARGAEAAAARTVAELADLWQRLGLHTLGDLAALPEASVHARFGDAGTWAQRLARGEDVRPPARRRVEGEIVAEQELDPPAERVDVAAFAARRLADDLHDQLARHGLSCGRLRITARAVDPVTGESRTLERLWRTDGALGGLSAARITDRVRWQLEGWLTAGGAAPIAHLALAAEEMSPAGALQPRLWGPSAGEDLRARRALERVQALLGGDAVLTVRLQGGRDPRDRVQLVPFGEEAPPGRAPDRPWPGSLPAPAPALVLPEPVPAAVVDDAGAHVVVDVRLALSGEPARVLLPGADGLPGEVRFDHAIAHRTAALTVHNRVIEADLGPERDFGVGSEGRAVTDWAGPWPVAERWWSSDARRRVFLQVVLMDGRGLLLSAAQGAWQLEAVYD
ncbi:DNA polymerase Y family protein [Antribacter sp. KLBMP9083]|uniref:DNA polymerase Y family protein n=1 Tax=Antribacter soli TaxID=2910976 RepID=A0AA41QEZ6_9MICO|nr:DNA polymerase Y family protein [Antribacter soli]MCF4121431.1 DNA polymerase Y family protein [Antribacter soli]